MKKQESAGNGEVGMELKYCEHCGGLWLRERGTETVYCDRCVAKVADLPATKKRSGRLILPVGPHSEVGDRGMEIEVEDVTDLEAMGGVA
jgi:hypothetical protein